MARTLLYRYCGNQSNNYQAWEMYWDHDARTHVRIMINRNSCTPYVLPKGTLLDSWCGAESGASTFVKITSVWDGIGRPPLHYRYVNRETGEVHIDEVYHTEELKNAVNCGGDGMGNPCDLKIVDVQVVDNGKQYVATIFTGGSYKGPIEYSLNNFVDVQDSNVFYLDDPGKFKAYARAKR